MYLFLPSDFWTYKNRDGEHKFEQSFGYIVARLYFSDSHVTFREYANKSSSVRRIGLFAIDATYGGGHHHRRDLDL